MGFSFSSAPSHTDVRQSRMSAGLWRGVRVHCVGARAHGQYGTVLHEHPSGMVSVLLDGGAGKVKVGRHEVEATTVSGASTQPPADRPPPPPPPRPQRPLPASRPRGDTEVPPAVPAALAQPWAAHQAAPERAATQPQFPPTSEPSPKREAAGELRGLMFSCSSTLPPEGGPWATCRESFSEAQTPPVPRRADGWLPEDLELDFMLQKVVSLASPSDRTLSTNPSQGPLAVRQQSSRVAFQPPVPLSPKGTASPPMESVPRESYGGAPAAPAAVGAGASSEDVFSEGSYETYTSDDEPDAAPAAAPRPPLRRVWSGVTSCPAANDTARSMRSTLRSSVSPQEARGGLPAHGADDEDGMPRSRATTGRHGVGTAAHPTSPLQGRDALENEDDAEAEVAARNARDDSTNDMTSITSCLSLQELEGRPSAKREVARPPPTNVLSVLPVPLCTPPPRPPPDDDCVRRLLDMGPALQQLRWNIDRRRQPSLDLPTSAPSSSLPSPYAAAASPPRTPSAAWAAL
eukprot:TRINITY_DN5929_c0_g1_i1.p1 TRINITY_DN5929_c0_g1~~TRINITY_DN5929_c0_g1_i1.p1  ORF type:complete len:518 (+),score=80.80 TRINITY_DN5929_c0_g1_i1:32-1585(+)